MVLSDDSNRSVVRVLARLQDAFKTYRVGMLELVAIAAVWFLFYGQSWDSVRIPLGGEYARSINSFYFWDMLRSCGSCAFWNPNSGGKPVLADPYGSFMHPISAVASLAVGALGGASLTLALAFLMIGLASYWLAVALAVHPLVRVWFALASMLGGHITSRLELGSVGMPLSLAALWLAFAALVWYGVRPSFWRMLLAAVCVGTLMLAGQLYYQYFFVLSAGVCLYYAWRTGYSTRHPRLRFDVLVGSVIVALFASPLLINMVMTMGMYEKEADAAMPYAVPLSTQIINFLLPDHVMSRADGLNPFPYVWAYATYIGFTPVIATVLGFRWLTIPAHRRFGVLVAVIGAAAMVLATGVYSKLLNGLEITVITDIASGFRWIAIYNGISGLAFLTFAALVFHAFLTNHHIGTAWVQRLLTWLQATVRFDARIMLIGLVAVYHLLGVHEFSKPLVGSFLITEPRINTMVGDLANQPPGYANVPDWMFLAAMEGGITTLPAPLGIIIKEHPFPPPVYEFATKKPKAFETSVIASYEDDWALYRNESPEAAYAAVIDESGAITPCVHSKNGGLIEVTCTAVPAGVLRIYEFGLRGWKATVDDGRTSTVPESDWLRVPLTAGNHRVSFSYAPWYAWAGLILLPVPWVLIIGLCVINYRRPATFV